MQYILKQYRAQSLKQKNAEGFVLLKLINLTLFPIAKKIETMSCSLTALFTI